MPVSRFKKSLMASLVLAITVSGPVAAQTGDTNITANLVIQVQELQDEVRTLRGRVEELERELVNVRQRQRDQYLDLDQRISARRTPDMPSSGDAAPVVDATPSASPVQPPVGTSSPDVPEVREPLDTPSQTVALGGPTVESQAAPVSPEQEKAAYEQAFQALKELRYADAAQEFQSFLDRYPNSELAGNAQYWLGESYYVTRNYEIALTAFQRLLNQYPQSNKVPDALLKLGYTHYELKQWDQARAALTQVQADYPDTTLARLAETRLRSMRMEGHY